jgi:hypothetical protein
MPAFVTHGDRRREDRAVRTPPKTVPRKIVESLLVVAAGVGLMAFGTYGSFTDASTPFPPVPVSSGR